MKEIILHTPKNIAFSKEIVKNLLQAVRDKLPAQIAIVPVSAKESLALNRRYRNKRAPANVLSFFYSPEYGEIIVCPALIRVEAKTQGHSFQYQMTWMIIHGMLHLAGIHHEASTRAERRFECIEQRVLHGVREQETHNKKLWHATLSQRLT